MTCQCQPVGLVDMAILLGVKKTTPQQWNHRGVLPPADWPSVSGRPVWCWPHTIKPWTEQVQRNPQVQLQLLISDQKEK